MRDATDTSVRLLCQHRAGDETALDELLGRQVQPMRRWARGRLPRWARDTTNTDDIVQDVLVRKLGEGGMGAGISSMEGSPEAKHLAGLHADCRG